MSADQRTVHLLWKEMVGKNFNLRKKNDHWPVTVLAVGADETSDDIRITYKPVIHDGMFSCTHKSFVERFTQMPSKRQDFTDHLEKCTFCRCEPKGDLNGLRLLCEPGAVLLKAFADDIVSRPATAEDFLAMVRGSEVKT